MKGLMRLESWIEQIVEEPFVRLFAGRLLPQEVAQHLVVALEDGERIAADGTPEVPGRYRIDLNPEDLSALKQYHPELEAELATALKRITQHLHIRLQEAPTILLYGDESLALRAVRITAADREPMPQEKTRDLDLEHLQNLLTREEENNLRAYLIVDGERTFDLGEQTIQLGRALDNDLILEDRRVSRYHAQLRYRYGRYILQDLGSTGGTRVNGFRVQETVLRPGDLISLSGVEIIYAEEDFPRREQSDGTQPITSR